MPITIGLCVKNCTDTILETLECIINQDYPSEFMEIIVVDDKSSDDTLTKIMKTLSNSHLTFKVFSTNGKGLGSARQLVVDYARGKYILWVDGDMILPRDHVKKQVRFMEQNPSIGKARAQWGILEENSLPAKLESMRLVEYMHKSNSSYLVGIGGSICRTDSLRAIGGFDINIHGAGEDIDLAIRLESSSWRSDISNAIFYHRFRKTWRGLWQQYHWYGYGMHYVNSKHKNSINLWKYIPPIPLLEGLRKAIVVYKFNKKLIAFLLPFQYTFKHVAWIIGYLRSHFDKCGD